MKCATRSHACVIALSSALLLAACGGAIDPGSPSDGGGADVRAPVVDASLANCPVNGDLPVTLECTGLYASIKDKLIAPGVRSYAPAVPLWADGASKGRWVALPDGTTIDDTKPGEWSFPIGTRFWKEFAVGGKRVETRYFVKLRPTYWAHTTYAWSDDESTATQSFGGDITVAGAPYHLPTPTECDQCHKGRTDRVLGFEAVGLGLDGAEGVTLATLVAEGRLSPPPASVHLTVGDDGTGAAAPALAWLHVNCGVSCHSPNSNASGYGTGMRLRLDPTTLDGRSPAAFDSVKTTANVPAITPAWSGETRIEPGLPDESLIVKLISTRAADGKGQMPPLATHEVDQADLAKVVAWISKMPHTVVPDAGPPDPGPVDGGAHDSGAPDASGPDASGPDASGPDASGPDTGAPLDAGRSDASSAGAGSDSGSGTDATVDAGEARDAAVNDAGGASDSAIP